MSETAETSGDDLLPPPTDLYTELELKDAEFIIAPSDPFGSDALSLVTDKFDLELAATQPDEEVDEEGGMDTQDTFCSMVGNAEIEATDLSENSLEDFDKQHIEDNEETNVKEFAEQGQICEETARDVAVVGDMEVEEVVQESTASKRTFAESETQQNLVGEAGQYSEDMFSSPGVEKEVVSTPTLLAEDEVYEEYAITDESSSKSKRMKGTKRNAVMQLSEESPMKKSRPSCEVIYDKMPRSNQVTNVVFDLTTSPDVVILSDTQEMSLRLVDSEPLSQQKDPWNKEIPEVLNNSSSCASYSDGRHHQMVDPETTTQNSHSHNGESPGPTVKAALSHKGLGSSKARTSENHSEMVAELHIEMLRMQRKFQQACKEIEKLSEQLKVAKEKIAAPICLESVGKREGGAAASNSAFTEDSSDEEHFKRKCYLLATLDYAVGKKSGQVRSTRIEEASVGELIDDPKKRLSISPGALADKSCSDVGSVHSMEHPYPLPGRHRVSMMSTVSASSSSTAGSSVSHQRANAYCFNGPFQVPQAPLPKGFLPPSPVTPLLQCSRCDSVYPPYKHSSDTSPKQSTPDTSGPETLPPEKITIMAGKTLSNVAEEADKTNGSEVRLDGAGDTHMETETDEKPSALTPMSAVRQRGNGRRGIGRSAKKGRPAEQRSASKKTPVEQRSTKGEEMPVEQRNANETPLEKRSANKETPVEKRSANKETPVVKRSANKETPLEKWGSNKEKPVEKRSVKKETPIGQRSTKKETPKGQRSTKKEEAPVEQRSVKAEMPVAAPASPAALTSLPAPLPIAATLASETDDKPGLEEDGRVAVFARWSDRLYYPGFVADWQPAQRTHRVNYYDGASKEMTTIHTIPAQVLAPGLELLQHCPVENVYYPVALIQILCTKSGIMFEVSTTKSENATLPFYHFALNESQFRRLKELPTQFNSPTITLDNIVSEPRCRGPRVVSLQTAMATPKSISTPKTTPVPKVTETPKVAAKTGRGRPRKILSWPEPGTSRGPSSTNLCSSGALIGLVPFDDDADSDRTVISLRGLEGGVLHPELSPPPLVDWNYKKNKNQHGTHKKHLMPVLADASRVKLLGLIPERGSNLFAGYNFLITHSNVKPTLEKSHKKKKKNSSSSSDESRLYMSLEEEEQTITEPFEKQRLRRQIQAGGGLLYASFDEVPRTELQRTVLISDKPCVTPLYLMALVLRVPRHRHTIIIRTTLEKRQFSEILMDKQTTTLLPAGWSCEKGGHWVEGTECDLPFDGLNILLALQDDPPGNFWKRLLKHAGAAVTFCSKQKNLENYNLSEYHVIVADEHFPPEVAQQARTECVKLMSLYWVVQSIIHGEVRRLRAHTSYKHDFMDRVPADELSSLSPQY